MKYVLHFYLNLSIHYCNMEYNSYLFFYFNRFDIDKFFVHKKDIQMGRRKILLYHDSVQFAQRFRHCDDSAHAQQKVGRPRSCRGADRHLFFDGEDGALVCFHIRMANILR